jgi:hypothetical protein
MIQTAGSPVSSPIKILGAASASQVPLVDTPRLFQVALEPAVLAVILEFPPRAMCSLLQVFR